MLESLDDMIDIYRRTEKYIAVVRRDRSLHKFVISV